MVIHEFVIRDRYQVTGGRRSNRPEQVEQVPEPEEVEEVEQAEEMEQDEEPETRKRQFHRGLLRVCVCVWGQ